ERPPKGSSVVAGHKRRPAGEAEGGGVVAGTAQRGEADIGAAAERVREFREQRQKQRTRASPEVGDAQRTPSAIVAIDCRERRLDHGLGLRPGQEGFGIDLERQAPKFLAAEKARDRLPRGTARPSSCE